jgi:Rod binding domain-containing protein
MKALDSASAAAQAAALQPSSYHDFSGLIGLKGRARQVGPGAQDDTALRAAAQQFEAMFLQEMMRSMRQATIKSDLLESNALDTFEGMFDKEVAMQMAKRGGMGMADMLVQQMKKHQAAESIASPPAAPPTDEPTEMPAEQATSTQDVLKGRQAAGLPLTRPAAAHELKPAQEQGGLPLPGPKAYPLGSGPQGMRLKARDLME